MRELVELQVNDDIAAQEPVVKHKVKEIVVAVKREPLLPGFEEETLAEFQQEFLQVGNQRRFEVRLAVIRLLVEAEKFEDEGLLQQILGPSDDLASFGEPLHGGFIAAEREAFKQTGGLLPFEFGHRPAFIGGLDLVEAALVWVLDRKEQNVVGPAQSKWKSSRLLRGDRQFPRSLPGNLGRGHFPSSLPGVLGSGDFPSSLPGNLQGGQFPRSLLGNLRNSIMPDNEEFPHVLKIRSREPISERLSQPGRKLLQQLGAIPRPLLPLLLVLHDAPADLEVRQHLKHVDRTGSSVAGGLDEVVNLGDEYSEVVGLPLHQGRLVS